MSDLSDLEELLPDLGTHPKQRTAKQRRHDRKCLAAKLKRAQKNAFWKNRGRRKSPPVTLAQSASDDGEVSR